MLTALVHIALALENHLWQSTAFAAVAWLLAFALRNNQARARYWIWLAASLKFLLPFSFLVAIGVYLRPARILIVAPQPLSTAIRQIAQPFVDVRVPGPFLATVAARDSNPLPLALFAIWTCGFLAILSCWLRRWSRVRKACRMATPWRPAGTVTLGCVPSSIALKASPTLLEPGVFGIFRPVLMLPEGIADRLTRAQLNAILVHEISHIRRRDNLTAALHMLVEAVFWFHPIVWWIGARLVEERENACDEEVMRLGGEPETYAEGILEVCKFYTESPVVCVSGVSGADLKKRIVRIMTRPFVEHLTLGRKVLLGIAASAVIAVPMVFGAALAPQLGVRTRRPLYLRKLSIRAALQSAAADAQGPATDNAPLPSFEVASIKLDNSGNNSHLFQFPDPGRFRTINMPARSMIQFAYNVKTFQVTGGPSWVDAKGYDIEAKIDDSRVAEMQKMPPEQRSSQIRLMLRSLLADRFKLQLSHEMKIEPEYALVVAKGGPKLTPTAWVQPDPNAPKPENPGRNGPHLMLSPGKISAVDQPVSGLCDLLAFMPEIEGRLVVDQTGIAGKYDYTVLFSSEALGKKMAEGAGAAAPPPDDSQPPIFTALEEQLGLRLENTKGPVDVYTIDHIEEPSEN
jgi:bla regulator protein blaR1